MPTPDCKNAIVDKTLFIKIKLPTLLSSARVEPQLLSPSKRVSLIITHPIKNTQKSSNSIVSRRAEQQKINSFCANTPASSITHIYTYLSTIKPIQTQNFLARTVRQSNIKIGFRVFKVMECTHHMPV